MNRFAGPVITINDIASALTPADRTLRDILLPLTFSRMGHGQPNWRHLADILLGAHVSARSGVLDLAPGSWGLAWPWFAAKGTDGRVMAVPLLSSGDWFAAGTITVLAQSVSDCDELDAVACQLIATGLVRVPEEKGTVNVAWLDLR